MRSGQTVTQHTHMSGEEIIHLFLYFALAFRVDGQEVAGEGQRVAAGFVARQNENKCLAHDLILGYHLFLLTPGGGLLWERTVVRIRGRRLCLLVPVMIRLTGVVRCVKVFQRHALLAGSCIQHQLKEVSTPLHAKPPPPQEIQLKKTM